VTELGRAKPNDVKIIMRLRKQKQSATRQSPSVALAAPRRTFLAENHLRPEVLNRQSPDETRTAARSLGCASDKFDTAHDQSVSVRFSHNFGQIPIFSKSDPRIQAKLAIGQPNDFYEQEADRVADRVMQMPEPQIQRTCDCGGVCPSCQFKHQGSEHHVVRTNSFAGSNASQSIAPPIVSEVLGSSGRPLDAQTRAYMEPRFGHDFSRVRIHTGGPAAEAARAVNALAFTMGDDVVFAAGQYDPGTREGKSLLAHELTHVVQQGFSTPVASFERTSSGFSKSSPGTLQRVAPAAAAPAVVAPGAVALIANCVVGAVISAVLDALIQYGMAKVKGEEHVHDWCGTIVSAIIGCMVGIAGAFVMAEIRAGFVVGGGTIGFLEATMAWLISRGIVVPPGILAGLIKLGCLTQKFINEQGLSITEPLPETSMDTGVGDTGVSAL
jgi:Domain of unknown function (DUF4157)